MSKKFGAEIIKNETEFRLRPAEQFDYPFLVLGLEVMVLKIKLNFICFTTKIQT